MASVAAFVFSIDRLLLLVLIGNSPKSISLHLFGFGDRYVNLRR